MSDKCPVYVVASKPAADGYPKGICLRCGDPLIDHEYRVSTLAPPGTGYVIDAEALNNIGPAA
jgi:hypothetical protein